MQRTTARARSLHGHQDGLDAAPLVGGGHEDFYRLAIAPDFSSEIILLSSSDRNVTEPLSP